MYDRTLVMARMIEKTIELYHADGAVFELCAINPKISKSALWEGHAGGRKGVVAGWYDDPARACKVVQKLDSLQCEGIYITLNPCNPALLSRSKNRLKAGADRTQDKDILRIRKLLVDVDPKRPAGISSTNAEHSIALEHADFIRRGLAARGWPDPLYGDSGNGAHLVYDVDLENSPGNIELLRTALQALNSIYTIHSSGVTLDIDTKVYNPSRISKVYGTTARKGDSTEERPHRAASIIDIPRVRRIVTAEQLREIISQAGAPVEEHRRTPRPRLSLVAKGSDFGGSGRLDLCAYLDHYGVAVRKTKNHGDAELFVLDQCLFDPSHSGGEAAIGQSADGKLFYQCFHDSCKTRTWADARQIISGADKLGRFMEGAGAAGAPAVIENVSSRIAELNEHHAVIMIGGKCVVMNEVTDPTFGRPDVTFSSVHDFRNYYANDKVFLENERGEAKAVSVAKLWFESPDRRQYKGITFSPGEDVPDYYNLYRGFGCRPRKGDWSLFRDHIHKVIAGGNDDAFFYILAWIAQLFQNPGGRRPGTALVLRGKRGAGKGCFASNIGRIAGPHFLQITDSNHLTGRFNNHLKDALLVFCDEGIWAGDKSAEGILKGMITEEHIAIEPKGKDVFMVRNHIRLIIASNENWVVPAGMEERRFFVLDVSDTHLQDHEYFRAVYAQMDNGGCEAMLHDLLALDISSVNLWAVPKTEALFDQIISSMNTAQKFWFERLRAGSLLRENDAWEDYVPTNQLYAEYQDFAKSVGDRYPLIDRMFTKELKKLCTPVYRTQMTVKASRRWVLQFPDLWTCRDQFANVLKINVDWDERRYDGKQAT